MKVRDIRQAIATLDDDADVVPVLENDPEGVDCIELLEVDVDRPTEQHLCIVFSVHMKEE